MTHEEFLLDYLRYYAGKEIPYTQPLNDLVRRITDHPRNYTSKADRRKLWMALRKTLDSLIKRNIVIRHRLYRAKNMRTRHARVRINEAFVKTCSIPVT
jgi:hypothetical protein